MDATEQESRSQGDENGVQDVLPMGLEPVSRLSDARDELVLLQMVTLGPFHSIPPKGQCPSRKRRCQLSTII